MDIVLLDFYLRFFAIIGNLFPKIAIENIRDFIRNSVLKELNNEIKHESITLFNEYYQQYSNPNDNIQNLLQTIREFKGIIPLKQKFQIILRILLFDKLLLKYSDNLNISFPELIEKIINELNIDTLEYQNCYGFISEKFYKVHDLHKLLIVSENKPLNSDIKYIQRTNLKGQLVFLFLENPNLILFIYKGNDTITYNNQAIYAGTVYSFSKGSSIKGADFSSIYYNQIKSTFKINEHINLKLKARDIEYKYKNSNNGIHTLSIDLESEQLVGIIGRSGVGKSTLINLLIGNKSPEKGRITINGLNLTSDKDKLDGLIGYVSQDDLLIEELTVYMNLFLNVKLCFGNLSDEVLKGRIDTLLQDLDLYDVKEMQVGTTLNRLLSGGQRKKLNIALELIREPWILFADEPTSGLSSSDSEDIMQLLSDETSKGRIVVVNIHQPSSDIFKLFDKIIVLDKEGYPVYFGNPLDAIEYFNDYNNRFLNSYDICEVCENVNSEAIFRILEEKKTNEFGEFTKERKITPKEWHQHYLLKQTSNLDNAAELIKLPKINFNKPNAFKQFLIFSKRNFLTKIANTQYGQLTLAISPVLAIVLSLLCRYGNNSKNLNDYVFALNENIPSYFFMSVIVALFLGLIMSAEEIIVDRKLLLRESYLKLSKISYLNSKIAFVFGISAFQTFIFVLIGNYILSIPNMLIDFWLILFSVSCFANLIGLFISALLKSVIAIYILVPLIIVPQMLLSGVVVNYDKLNKYVSSREYVPFVGDIMASRWAYEAMVVRQFSANSFQKYYFDIEKKESNIKFNLVFVVPEIKKVVTNLKKNKETELIDNNNIFIENEFNKLNTYLHLRNGLFNSKVEFEPKYFDQISSILSTDLNTVSFKKDSITKSIITNLGDLNKYLNLKSNNYNNSIADLVLKRKELEPYIITQNKIIRQLEPIYQDPISSIGRAHFLSASKKIGGYIVNTYYFNLFVLWFMSIITYITLIVLICVKNPFQNHINHFKNNIFKFNRSLNK